MLFERYCKTSVMSDNVVWFHPAQGPQKLGDPGSFSRLNDRFLRRHCSEVVVTYYIKDIIADDADVSSKRKSAQLPRRRRHSVLTTTAHNASMNNKLRMPRSWLLALVPTFIHRLTSPYLAFGVGAKYTSAEASIWAQCATPTDFMVEEIS